MRNLHVRGFVQDLSQNYDRCAFAIAPIYSGGGSSIKILEALAHGRTCLTTQSALEAFRPHLNESNCIATDSDSEMARQCIDLLQNDARRRQLAEAGHAVVSTAFGYDAFRQSVKEQVQILLGAA